MLGAFAESFDAELVGNLTSCGLDFSSPCVLAVAVSGGADSVSLLTSLFHIVPSCFNLLSVTVNHNLREESETAGDAAFVEDYCASLGIPCFRYDIPRGQIVEESRRQGLSLEEAARNARYACFERFITEHAVDYLCLAHNRNDQLETVLMRFLAGGGLESLSGIAMRRGKYLRPLLSVSRTDIERYLKEQGLSYRTDSTNADNAFLRNRIRNVLVPVLDDQFSGWSTALQSLSSKMREDASFFEREVAMAWKRCGCRLEAGRILIDAASFRKESKSIRIRLFFAAADRMFRAEARGESGRIPYVFFANAADGILSDSWRDSSSGIRIRVEGPLVLLERNQQEASEAGFCLLVRGEGCYQLGPFSLSVRKRGEGGSESLELGLHGEGAGGNPCLVIESLAFPFLIRSRQPGDRISSSGGGSRSVSSILDAWKCSSLKDCIPLIQRLDLPDQDLIAIWAAPFGFKNWLVKY